MENALNVCRLFLATFGDIKMQERGPKHPLPSVCRGLKYEIVVAVIVRDDH